MFFVRLGNFSGLSRTTSKTVPPCISEAGIIPFETKRAAYRRPPAEPAPSPLETALHDAGPPERARPFRREQRTRPGAKAAPDGAPRHTAPFPGHVRRRLSDAGFQPPHGFGVSSEAEHVHRRQPQPAHPGSAHQAQYRLELQEQQPHPLSVRFGKVRRLPEPGEIEPAGTRESEGRQRTAFGQSARRRAPFSSDEERFAPTHVVGDPRPEQAVGDRVRHAPYPAVRQEKTGRFVRSV